MSIKLSYFLLFVFEMINHERLTKLISIQVQLLDEIEGMARYAGQLLPPAVGFGLRPRFVFCKKKRLIILF